MTPACVSVGAGIDSDRAGSAGAADGLKCAGTLIALATANRGPGLASAFGSSRASTLSAAFGFGSDAGSALVTTIGSGLESALAMITRSGLPAGCAAPSAIVGAVRLVDPTPLLSP